MDELILLALRLLLVVGATTIGLLLAEAFEATNIGQKIARLLAHPLATVGVDARLAVAAPLALASPHAEHALVSRVYREQGLEDHDVIGYALVVSPLRTIYALYRFTLPITLPLLGPLLALANALVNLAVAMVKALVGILYLRGKKRNKYRSTTIATPYSFTSTQYGHRNFSLKRVARYVKKLAIRLVIVYTLTNLLIKYLPVNLIDSSTPLLSIALVYAIDMYSGYIVAAQFYRHGVLSATETMAGLVLGKIFFHLVKEYPFHTFPFYTVYYPTKLAVKMTVVNMIATIVTLIIILIPLLLL